MRGSERDSNRDGLFIEKKARIAIDAMRATRTYSLPGYASRESQGSTSLRLADNADFTNFPQEHLLKIVGKAENGESADSKFASDCSWGGSAEVGYASEQDKTRQTRIQ